MEESPFSQEAVRKASASDDHGLKQNVLTTEKLLKRVSSGRRPSLKPNDLQTINQIDLDGERLTEIPAAVLTLIPATTRLFLQNNSLSDTTMLHVLVHLRYLNLSCNRITRVQGLRSMKHLMGLNLMQNRITVIEASDLPASLQYLHVKGNPVADDADALTRRLAEGLPSLRQVDGFDVQSGRNVTGLFIDAQSSGESDGTANALVEAAMQDVAEEDLQRAKSALKALEIEPSILLRNSSAEILERLGSSVTKGGPSPIIVTPTASRQTSVDLSDIQTNQHAQGFAARIREALPTVREAQDLGMQPEETSSETRTSTSTQSQLSMSSNAGLASRRSISLSTGGTSSSLAPTTSDLRHNFRALTLPANTERKFSGGHRLSNASSKSPGQNAVPIFPLVQAPPPYSKYPVEFKNTLSSAISMLIGSTALPKRVAFQDIDNAQTVWEKSQDHRQKVLDYLFAKRTHEEPLKEFDKDAVVPIGKRTSFDRYDSAISNHESRYHGRQKGSIISDEMLQGLLLRDPPRAEGLSAAMQGPPTDPPGVQLAALSKDEDEKAAAERVRAHLRRSLVKTLDNAQKRRELEPAAESSVVSELQKLKETKSLRNLLAARSGHMPLQPHVLATILESHSRLGSITDRLEKSLPRTSSYRVEIDDKPLTDLSVHHHPNTDNPSPFASQSIASESFSAASEGPQTSDRPSLLEPRRSTAASGLGGEPRQMSPSKPRPRSVNTGRAARAHSSRRQMPEPGSPGSDQDPDPPKTRQDARPIFGGIAKMFRGQSGAHPSYQDGRAAEASAAASRPSLGGPPVPKASFQQMRPASNPQSASLPGQGGTPPASSQQGRMTRDRSSMLRAAPGTQSQKTMNISRAGSSYLGVLQTSDDLKLIQTAAQEAEKKNADFQAELWQRMSGMPMNAQNLTNDPENNKDRGNRQDSTMLPSPFSPFSKTASQQTAAPAASPGPSVAPEGGPFVAPSPFSQAAQPPPQRQTFESSFVTAPPRVAVETELSPFAQSALPPLKPPDMPGRPIGQSAFSTPVLATQPILTDNGSALPDAASTPPNNTLREALQTAVKVHRRGPPKQSAVEGSSLVHKTQSEMSTPAQPPPPDAKSATKTFKSPFSL